jgi:recombination protein RecA
MQETQLDHAISAIRVRFGSQALTRAAELPPPQPWPSCTPLDRLTGIGGLPRGRLTLLTGSGTCGKLTLALAILAAATHEFAHAVVIDNHMGQGGSAGRALPGRRDRGEPPLSFDPWALLPFDPDLSSLTVVRLQAEPAGEAAAALAKAGAGFLLLMGEVPEPWIGPMESGANRSGTVLLGVVDAPGRAFAHASSLSLGFSKVGWIVERGQLVGLRTYARCLKNRVAPPIGEAELEIRYPLGAQLFLEHTISEAQPLSRVAELECESAAV